MACRGAFILAYFGVKSVKVLDCKFGSWNAKSETELKKPDVTLATSVDFVANKEWIA
jgi:3-mercaptopyruvate sulfurtransferase SseA